MESQLLHTHGHHYDESDILTTGHNTGYVHNEDEHHGEKKSVIKKVKEKAKKIKNTITKHGHGHHHEEDDDDFDDEEETVQDPEVHGAPMYDSARVHQGGLDASLGQPKVNLERPSVTAEDRYTAPAHNVSEPLSVGRSQEKWSGKIGQASGMEEEPFAPNPTRMATPTNHTLGTRLEPDPAVNHDVHQGGLKGVTGKMRMVPDPHAPKDSSDPSNYGTKVTNPTHTGGKEAQLSQLQHSFDKMGIESEPKTLDHNHPENLPRDTLTGNQSTQSYVNKISSSASAIADKAVAAKDVIASKLGYSGQTPTTESGNNQSTATDYAHKITDKVTGTLAPVYDKVVDAGSSVISKVQGSVSGTEQPQSHPQMRGSSETLKVSDKGVSVKEHLVERLRPREEDKALSDVITHALHRGNEGESGKKSGEDRPMGTVTESEEVRRRLGSNRREEHDDSSNVVAEKGVSERLMDAVGSWFGGKGDAPQGTLGTSYVTDEGLSSNPRGDQNRGSSRD